MNKNDIDLKFKEGLEKLSPKSCVLVVQTLLNCPLIFTSDNTSEVEQELAKSLMKVSAEIKNLVINFHTLNISQREQEFYLGQQIRAIVRASFFSDPNAKSDVVISYLSKNAQSLYEHLSREEVISLFSAGVGASDVAYTDVNSLVNDSRSFEFKIKDIDLPNIDELKEMSVQELAEYLVKTYAIKSVSLNSMDTEPQLKQNLLVLCHQLNELSRTTGIGEKSIGDERLKLDIGRVFDDCNGFFQNEKITLTRKANESIFLHEWMHWFDTSLSELPKYKKAKKIWGDIQSVLEDDKFDKNEFNLQLYKQFSAQSYLHRFIVNHVKDDKKEEFTKELEKIAKKTIDVISNSVSAENESKKKQESAAQQASDLNQSILKFEQKFNTADYFLGQDFLKRYLSFFRADISMLEKIVQNKIKTKKSVFRYQSTIADKNLGHIYSGDTMELVARSFEEFLVKFSDKDLGLDTNSMWYPKLKERDSLVQKWKSTFEELLKTGLFDIRHDEAADLSQNKSRTSGLKGELAGKISTLRQQRNVGVEVNAEHSGVGMKVDKMRQTVESDSISKPKSF